jgi:hypothetical protein
VRRNFTTLFTKCTTAVRPIAMSTGRNKAKAGMSSVPYPNPEKNDNNEARNATNPTKKYSIIL